MLICDLIEAGGSTPPTKRGLTFSLRPVQLTFDDGHSCLDTGESFLETSAWARLMPSLRGTLYPHCCETTACFTDKGASCFSEVTCTKLGSSAKTWMLRRMSSGVKGHSRYLHCDRCQCEGVSCGVIVNNISFSRERRRHSYIN